MAAGDATISTLSNILKTKYDQKKFNQFAYQKKPLVGMMRKDEKFGGNNARITIRYGVPQGGSADFATAQTNKSTSNDAAFLITRKKDYHVAGISGEAIAAGEGNENTIYDALKGEMEGSLLNITRSISICSYRNGGGARGKGDGVYSVAGTLVQLATPSDATNFEVGMFVQFASTDGTSGSVRTGSLKVTGINRLLGTLTLASAVNTIAGVVNTDYIFRAGDFLSVTSLATGLQGWLPATAPTGGDNWYGQDRSADTMRLAGILYNGNGGNKEETLVDAMAYGAREGASFDVVFTNPLDRADLVKSLGTKASFVLTKATDGIVGYKALVVEGEEGEVKVVSDVSCPKGTFWPVQMDTWVMKSAKAAPRYLDEDGPKFLRETNADGYEWRLGAYYNIGCEAPGYNVSGTW